MMIVLMAMAANGQVGTFIPRVQYHSMRPRTCPRQRWGAVRKSGGGIYGGTRDLG